jgi:hypothetical protein
MEDDSKFGNVVKFGLGAVGLGGVVAAVTLPKPFGIWVAVIILVLALLFFGGYYLWRRLRARRRSRAFSSAIEAQTAAAPKAISDPNQRAALDKLRQKFQTGMQEFKSRGKDIYKLPWYVIIGESGSGKTEAIRHSGIEFPPGLQDELQGSGGTVNMDWWFTNRGIILDTAGSMIFRETQAGEAPEWGEFLRLLKKSRPHCPVNGLFLVLSIESLIKDSADRIAEKASRLAQQLDLIQRTLDVRFPVYLLVTKADLLTGFREFFDNIEDPLLQHQMFGWSNPDPLDSHFRPDLVEQHLKSVADRLRRRRLALLLRESSFAASRMGETTFFTAAGSRGGQRRLDEMDALFALPESVMRLVPRLRRYLETVFVAGEWSAKPVFLRGIYFTSSMREGKALDEAIALATGLSVDQLPEDRSWDKNRAFFLRDLFVEKVFRESGLVTRATNTIQLLRKRQFAIFGTAGAALLLLITLAAFGYGNLKRTVLAEAVEWEAGAKGWNQGSWSPAIVRPGAEDVTRFTYAGTNQVVQVGDNTLSVVDYHQRLQSVVAKPLPVSFIFKPLSWFGIGPGNERKTAQRVLFDHGVLKPLVDGTKAKMSREPDATSVTRHQNALQSLIQLQADAVDASKSDYGVGTNAAASYLGSFLAYLTESDAVKVDPNLADVFAWTYSQEGSGAKDWPPKFLVGGDNLTNNRAIWNGFEGLRKANLKTEAGISNRLAALNNLTADFIKYREVELKVLAGTGNLCDEGIQNLGEARRAINNGLDELYAVAVTLERPLTNLSRYYDILANEASSASALAIERNLHLFPESFKQSPLFSQIDELLKNFKKRAADSVRNAKSSRGKDLAELDQNYISPPPGGTGSAYEVRWGLFLGSCSLLTNRVVADDRIIGNLGQRFNSLTTNALHVSSGLQTYRGAFAEPVATICTRIIGQNVEQLKLQFVANYATHISNRLTRLKFPLRLNATEAFTGSELVATRKNFVLGLEADLKDAVWQSFPASAPILGPLRTTSYTGVANGLANPDGTIAEMEILFTPPTAGSGDARLYTGFLRYLKVSVDGKEKFNQDLSRFAKDTTAIVTNVPVSASVKLEFYSNVDRTSGSAALGEESWLLPRLIQKDQAQRLPTRDTEWKLKLPATVNGAANTLEAFAIRLKNPLPKKEDWPK